MPRYNYRCSECGAVEEQKHGFNDEPQPMSCHNTRPQKIYPSVGVTFKGSGFYTTDKDK